MGGLCPKEDNQTHLVVIKEKHDTSFKWQSVYLSVSNFDQLLFEPELLTLHQLRNIVYKMNSITISVIEEEKSKCNHKCIILFLRIIVCLIVLGWIGFCLTMAIIQSTVSGYFLGFFVLSIPVGPTAIALGWMLIEEYYDRNMHKKIIHAVKNYVGTLNQKYINWIVIPQEISKRICYDYIVFDITLYEIAIDIVIPRAENDIHRESDSFKILEVSTNVSTEDKEGIVRKESTAYKFDLPLCTSIVNDKSFRILVKMLSGCTQQFKVHSNNTISDIKLQIKKRCNISTEEQILMHQGEELEDKCTFLDCRIQQATTLYLATRPMLNSLTQLKIRTLTDYTMTLNVTPDDSIQSIKLQIEKNIGINARDQRLIFRYNYHCTELNDNCTLSNYLCDNSDTLYLLTRIRTNCDSLKIESEPGAITLESNQYQLSLNKLEADFQKIHDNALSFDDFDAAYDFKENRDVVIDTEIDHDTAACNVTDDLEVIQDNKDVVIDTVIDTAACNVTDELDENDEFSKYEMIILIYFGSGSFTFSITGDLYELNDAVYNKLIASTKTYFNLPNNYQLRLFEKVNGSKIDIENVMDLTDSIAANVNNGHILSLSAEKIVV